MTFPPELFVVHLTEPFLETNAPLPDPYNNDNNKEAITR